MFFPMEANTQTITVSAEAKVTVLPAEGQAIDYAAYGFRNTGFGAWVRKTEIHVDIVVQPYRDHDSKPYGVYVFHGAPGGAYWRGSEPLVRCATLEEAKAKARTLYGIVGSDQFANIIYL